MYFQTCLSDRTPEGRPTGVQHICAGGIVLQVNTNPTIDVALAVGNVGELVTVAASSATVETRSTGVGQVIDNQQVMEIPLNGRQATELIFSPASPRRRPPGT